MIAISPCIGKGWLETAMRGGKFAAVKVGTPGQFRSFVAGRAAVHGLVAVRVSAAKPASADSQSMPNLEQGDSGSTSLRPMGMAWLPGIRRPKFSMASCG